MSGDRAATTHWWRQRLTALALVPLGLYVLYHLVRLAGADHAAVTQWLREPLAFGAMSLFVAALLEHLSLGVQVVIEDYVHDGRRRIALLAALQLGCVALAVAAITALAAIAFIG